MVAQHRRLHHAVMEEIVQDSTARPSGGYTDTIVVQGDRALQVKRCTLRRIHMPLRTPTRTSYGVHTSRDVIIVELETVHGAIGVSECVAMREPTYTEETVFTAWHILQDFLVGRLRDKVFETPADLRDFSDGLLAVRGNAMARASLEMAVWDAFAAETQTPIHLLLGGQEREIPVGISLGMESSIGRLQERALQAAEDGYRRIKVKVSPGEDLLPLRAIRSLLPDMPLMADANSAYRTADEAVWAELDELSLMMIEQPLAHDDLVDHAALQRRLRTPLCLDESIRSADDVRRAAVLGACRIINLKPGRVGGFEQSRRAHDFAVHYGLGLWCGGMYETGIGRLHNIALCSLPGFDMPTDVGPSERYFVEDVVNPPVTFSRPGHLRVEELHGVASRVNWTLLDRYTIDSETIHFRH
ncbi:o-succinylbenzoate synthase [Alicyclobacillus fastidiosus]|uniref:o-succinylbenzoate synthase n=1 Tax=Alicyclobacillus fastidiosus TaxID=392011 RepID=A0ABY6ZHK4_9BACL|nr:o-succinylbenzoate synthase [Alicyclobacillus fastidiosus]WAH41609.1 o-succinylbenzoate synthase [Alicyclobacillus fastidiosus]